VSKSLLNQDAADYFERVQDGCMLRNVGPKVRLLMGTMIPLSQFTVGLDTGMSTDVIEMILHAGTMVKFVLLLLFLFSVVSWGIIFFKARTLRRARIEDRIFLELFWAGGSMGQIYKESRHLEESPLAALYRTGFAELSKVKKEQAKGSAGQETLPEAFRNLDSMGIENTRRALNRAKLSQMTRLSKALSFLATTGNTTPFIGLFGTVWGIMASFRGIGLRGSASLAVVAPGISEALVATAAGLAAAIPAVVFFNYFSNKINVREAEMENFTLDFLNILEREVAAKFQET